MSEENQYLAVIRIWAAMAWADGQIVDKERAALVRLIGGADLTEGEREVAQGYIDRKVELDGIQFAGMSKYAREGIYRAACKLSAIDRDVSTSERQILIKLRALLELDRESAEDIERSAGLP